MKANKHDQRGGVALCAVLALLLGCERIPRCAVFAEEANCTHLLSISPPRLSLDAKEQQTLMARFAEEAVTEELPHATDLEVTLQQDVHSRRLGNLTVESPNVTVEVSPNDLVGLKPGTAQVVVQYKGSAGTRRASRPVILSRAVQFQSKAMVTEWSSAAVQARQVALVPPPASDKSRRQRLAVAVDFPSAQNGEESRRVCFLDALQLGSFPSAIEPTQPTSNGRCPMAGCANCPMAIDEQGCVLRLRYDNELWRTLVRVADKDNQCQGEELARTNYQTSSLFAGDARSTLLAIASPSRGNQQDASVWLLSSAPLKERFSDTVRDWAVSVLAVGDVNRDGYADAVAIARSNTLLDAKVWVQHAEEFHRDNELGKQLTTQIQRIELEQNGSMGWIVRTPVALAVADMDQDGWPDVVLLTRNQAPVNLQDLAVELILGRGTDGFASPQRIPLPDGVANRKGFANAHISVGDVNGDQALDLVLTGDDGQVGIVFQQIP